MKQPAPLLRIGTITFFVLMIMGAVWYRYRTSEEQAPVDENREFSSDSDYFQYKKAYSGPWYDHAAFVKIYGFEPANRWSGTKSGVVFQPKTRLTKRAVYDLLEMRYEAARLSDAESVLFHQTFSRIHQFPKLRFARELPADIRDSVDALLYIKVGATQLSGLSVKETNRFNQLWNERRKWRQQQKTDLMDIRDTIQILQTLKLEKYTRKVSPFMYYDYGTDFPAH